MGSPDTTASKETFKKDMSMMEYPLYFLSEEGFETVTLEKGKRPYEAMVWRQGDYWYECVAGVPSDYDYLFLAYLLILCQKQKWSPVIEISIREILKGCGIPPGSHWYYKRVKQSLEVWERVRFHFEGESFRYKALEGDKLVPKFKEIHAGIVSNWKQREGSTTLIITLDSEFLAITQSSMFYKTIEFNDLIQLRGEPTAIRLHEILLKSFESGNTWEIGVKKLGVKLTIKDRYPSRIRNKVATALDVINKKTRREFTMEYLGKEEGYKPPKFRFKIIRNSRKQPEQSQSPSPDEMQQVNGFLEPQLPLEFPQYKERRPDILKMVDDFFEYLAKQHPEKVPDDLNTAKNKSYDTIEALIQEDGNDFDFVQSVLVFGTINPFWKNRFFSLNNLRDVAENQNTTFINMANSFQGIKNPASKKSDAETDTRGGGDRFNHNLSVVAAFSSTKNQGGR